MWLPQLKLPVPGALGLFTCAGGGKPGDTRITLDGLDPALGKPYRRSNRVTEHGQPAEQKNGESSGKDQ